MEWFWDAIRRVQPGSSLERRRVLGELDVIRCRRQSDASASGAGREDAGDTVTGPPG